MSKYNLKLIGDQSLHRFDKSKDASINIGNLSPLKKYIPI